MRKQNKSNIEISKEQQDFLRKIRRKNIFIILVRWMVLFAIIGFWELAAYLKLIDTFIFSSPSRIFAMIISLFEGGTFFYHIWVTLRETIIGFILGITIGFVLSIMIWSSQTFSKIIEPYLVVLNSLPKIALGPIIIVWAGAGESAIIVMTLLISVIVTVMGLANGFSQVEPAKITLLKCFGAKKIQILTKVVLPASVPSLISTIKINVGMTWIGVIMGEFLVSKAGLGYLIVYGGQVFKLDLVMAGVVVLSLLASLMYFAVAAIEKKFAQKYNM